MNSEKFVIIALVLVVSFIAIWSVVKPSLNDDSLGITGNVISNQDVQVVKNASNGQTSKQNPTQSISYEEPVIEKPKEYRFKCVQNCDRGLNIVDQASFAESNYIYIQLENNNPRKCDMSCNVLNGIAPMKNVILYGQNEGYRIESDKLAELSLVCQEAGKDGSNYQVQGCEVAIKQTFIVEELE